MDNIQKQNNNYLSNKTYYLCIEDFYAGTVISEWMYAYKDAPLYFRDARKGVEGSFVLAIKDEDGKHLSFINRIAEVTKARISVK